MAILVIMNEVAKARSEWPLFDLCCSSAPTPRPPRLWRASPRRRAPRTGLFLRPPDSSTDSSSTAWTSRWPAISQVSHRARMSLVCLPVSPVQRVSAQRWLCLIPNACPSPRKTNPNPQRLTLYESGNHEGDLRQLILWGFRGHVGIQPES